MREFLIFISGVGAGIVTATICFVMIAHTPVSDLTGGYGQVTAGGTPLVGANVSVADVGGTLSAVTDANGKFDIKVDSRRMFYLSTANPMNGSVTMTIENGGSVLVTRQFEKRRLGENYFDLGTIDVAPR